MALKLFKMLGIGSGAGHAGNALTKVSTEQRQNLQTAGTNHSWGHNFASIPLHAKPEVVLVPQKPLNITKDELERALNTIATEDAAALQKALEANRIFEFQQKQARAHAIKEWVRSQEAFGGSEAGAKIFDGPVLEVSAAAKALPNVDSQPAARIGQTWDAQRLPFSPVFALPDPQNKNG